jgi:murein DD-endopeptidase MepM/ murein hydrolase activator NlpD
MSKAKRVLRFIFVPITVMIIPHSTKRPVSLRLPSIAVILAILLWTGFTVYIASVGVTTKEYYALKKRLDFYKDEFMDITATVKSLKQADAEFKRLFSLNTREEIFETLDTSDTGSIDIELIKKQIEKSMNRIGEIRDYIRKQRDIYFATPMGLPVDAGYISSGFGWRRHPKTGRKVFHSGVDVAAWPGTPVRATADGIVSFAGWSGGSGKLIVIEHGFGYRTCYAHNKKIVVKVGQIVKRGDIIAYVGSTGNTTGPHVHYEVWIDGKPVNPKSYIGRSYVGEKDRQG